MRQRHPLNTIDLGKQNDKVEIGSIGFRSTNWYQTCKD